MIVRADGGPRIGTGHLGRTLALARTLRARGAEVALVTLREAPAAMLERWRGSGAAVHIATDAPAARAQVAALLAAREVAGTALVLDGYSFTGEDAEEARARGARVLFVDDAPRLPRYDADGVLDHNAGATAGRYHAPSATILAGPRYALLRPEFVAARARLRRAHAAHPRVLVTLGGSDVGEEALAAVRAIPAGTTGTLVVAGATTRLDELRALARERGVDVVVEAADMAALMASHDLAITAGGVTLLEAASLGLPTLCRVVAENQRIGAEAMERAGASLRVAREDLAGALRALIDDAPRRELMSRAGLELVDAHGAARVADWLLGGIAMRRATIDDARVIWEWANDRETRANSFAGEPIPWETHVAWITRKLADPTALLLMAEGPGGAPLAHVRLDRDAKRPDLAMMSINVGPAARGQGVGWRAIAAGCAEAERAWGCRAIDALVKAENQRSRRAFERAGFRLATERADGVLAFRYEPSSSLLVTP